MSNSNVSSQVSRTVPAVQPAPATKTVNKSTSPLANKKDAGDRFIPAGAGEKDVIRQLNELGQKGPTTQGRAVLTEIAKKQWSPSPEFARAFLQAVLSLGDLINGKWEDQPDREKFLRDLRDRMRQAILNLIPKDTPPPKIVDKTHREILPLALLWILKSYPLNLESKNDGLIFINRIVQERPLYADILCRYLRLLPLDQRFVGSCWGDFSKKVPLR